MRKRNSREAEHEGLCLNLNDHRHRGMYLATTYRSLGVNTWGFLENPSTTIIYFETLQ